MTTLVNPDDSPARQNEKLLRIADALMRRVELATDQGGADYSHFQRAVLLEAEVRARTAELEKTLALLNTSNAQLSEASAQAEAARKNLANAIETIQEGFALFSAEETLVQCNSRFGMHMPDIRENLVPGLSFEAYIAIISNSEHLELPDGKTPEIWARLRRRRHLEQHVNFIVAIRGDKWVQVSEHRMPDGGTVVMQTDVTEMILQERQEREKLLDDQARIIRATLDHINQGVCIFDRDQRLIGWNRRLAAIFSPPINLIRTGMRFDTLLGNFLEDLSFSAGQSEDRLLNWVRSPAPKSPLAMELRHRGSVHLDLFAQAMPDGGFVISFTDVTAEREAIEAMAVANESLERRVFERTLELEDALSEAERANASKNRFVAAASHDLLQPLSAAKLFTSVLSNDRSETGTVETARKIQNALQSIEMLIEALLEISKLDAGRVEVQVVDFSLDALLSSMWDEFDPAAKSKGLSITIEPCDEVVKSDPVYLRRILQNLIGNAIKYTDEGSVSVGVRAQDNSVRITVTDTGHGIPEAAQDQIFDEFVRLDSSKKDGIGLGLAIVERACRLLGHALSLKSVEGEGSCFEIAVERVRPTGT